MPDTPSTAIQPGKWSGDIDIVVQVPKGTRGRYMGGETESVAPTNPVRPAPGAPTASMPSEMEFLVERGTSFKIEKAELGSSHRAVASRCSYRRAGGKAGTDQPCSTSGDTRPIRRSTNLVDQPAEHPAAEHPAAGPQRPPNRL